MLINYDHAFRGAKKRWIYVPTAASRQMGKEISVLITDRWQAPDFYYHFKSGGHVSAIELHKKHKYFVKIDIEKFFPNISRNRVVNSLKKISIPYKKAVHIADWSCVASKEDLKKRILPYGFVQSQILSALCLDKSAVGQCLRVISQDVLVSVYVDDIIISSNNTDLLQAVMGKVLSSFDMAGFIVNQSKSHAPKKELTAFNILLQDNGLAITEERLDQFKTALNLGQKQQVDAILGYVSKVSLSQRTDLENYLRGMS